MPSGFDDHPSFPPTTRRGTLINSALLGPKSSGRVGLGVVIPGARYRVLSWERLLKKADAAAVSVERQLVASMSSSDRIRFRELLECCISNLDADQPS